MNTDEPTIWKSTWHLLGSVRFALIIVLLLAGASIFAVAIGAFVVPPGQSMDGLGRQILAGARFALDQQGGVAAGGAFQQGENPTHA